MLYEAEEGAFLLEYSGPGTVRCASDGCHGSLEDLYDDRDERTDEKRGRDTGDPE